MHCLLTEVSITNGCKKYKIHCDSRIRRHRSIGLAVGRVGYQTWNKISKIPSAKLVVGQYPLRGGCKADPKVFDVAITTHARMPL